MNGLKPYLLVASERVDEPNGTCVEECSAGTYSTGVMCVTCHSTCVECYDEGKDYCLTCPEDYPIRHRGGFTASGFTFSYGECLDTECDYGAFDDDINFCYYDGNQIN